VTQADIEENLQAIDELGLPVDVVQIDDGYQAELGDWLQLSDRFPSLAAIVGVIRRAGRRAGIWVAPFLVGERSELARAHPDWLVDGARAGHGWGGQRLFALDTTHPGAEGYLRGVFGTLRELGVDYFKIDFVYAGAMAGRRADPTVAGVEAYRHGLRLVRDAIGPEAFLLGCGAPILPSVGLVDAMRVGPDIAHHVEPLDGDLSQPSQRAAAQNSRWRAWQQGRFWTNDADCLVTGTHVERREEWAGIVARYSGCGPAAIGCGGSTSGGWPSPAGCCSRAWWRRSYPDRTPRSRTRPLHPRPRESACTSCSALRPRLPRGCSPCPGSSRSRTGPTSG
jgi:alpha-galactosidase